MADVKKIGVSFYLVSVLTACVTTNPLTTQGKGEPDEVTALQASSICNHQFSKTQIQLQPDYVEEEESTIITGNTRPDLLRSLFTTVPSGGVGNTHWELKWDFDSRLTVGGCSTRSVQTQVRVRYQLPLWPDQVYATDRDLADEWVQFGDALRAHHCMHGKAGIDASIEVKKALQAMEPHNNCTQLEVEANALARSIINKYKERESRFEAPVVTDYIQR